MVTPPDEAPAQPERASESASRPYEAPRLTGKHAVEQVTLSIGTGCGFLGGRPIPGGPGCIGNP
jgi:hypothetical protein